jgi:hypothetical protein
MSHRFEHKFEHTLERKPADNADGAVTTVRRLELITGTGRRRQWSADDKALIVVESLKPGANVSEGYRKALEIIRAHIELYDPEFVQVFVELIAKLDPPTAGPTS